MPGWTNVSALVSNVAAGFSFSYPFASSVSVSDKDAGILLDQVNKVLTNANATLALYQSVLPDIDYDAFIAQHRVFHVRLTEVQLQHRDLDEELIRQGRIPSGTNETKEAVQGRALDLLNAVEEYENRVVHASRNASNVVVQAFPDEEPMPLEPKPAPVAQTSGWASNTPTLVEPTPSYPAPAPSPPTRPPSSNQPMPSFTRSNLGLSKRINSPSITGSTPGAEKPARPAFQADKDLQFAVTHTPLNDDDPRQSSDPTRKLYLRTVVIRYGDEVLDIPDPEPRELEDGQVTLDATTLFALQDVIQKWVSEILARDLD